MKSDTKGFSMLLVALVMAVILGGAGFYYYKNQKSNMVRSQDSFSKTPTVIVPGGGEQWEVGGTYEIKWAGVTKAAKVSINYQSPFGLGKIGGADNGGSYRWMIPANTRPGNNYQIIITTPGKDFDVAWSKSFSIVAAGAATSQGSSSGASSGTAAGNGSDFGTLSGGGACGQLPPDFRSDIPVPPDSCLVQVIPMNYDGYKSYAVFYESQKLTSETSAFFDSRLAGEGWRISLVAEQVVALPPGMIGHGYKKGDVSLVAGVQNNPNGGTRFYIGYKR